MIDQLCVFHSVVTIKIDQLLYDRSVVRISFSCDYKNRSVVI